MNRPKEPCETVFRLNLPELPPQIQEKPGVYYHTASGRWYARVCCQGRLKPVGLYMSRKEAEEAFSRLSEE